MIQQDLSLISYVEMYLLARDVSPEYAATLRARCRKFSEWCGRGVKVTELTDELVSSFLAHLQAEQQLTSSTIRGYRQYLIAVWSAAYEDRLTDTRPSRVRLIKMRLAAPRCWTLKQIREQLLPAARKTKGKFRGSSIPKAHFLEAWIRTALNTGLRASDQFLLRNEDARQGRFTVIQHKTGFPVVCQLSEATLDAIDRMGWDGEFVFPWYSRREQWYFECRQMIRRAGLTGTMKYLRRAAGTYAELERPGSGHEVLGQRDPGVFNRFYRDRTLTDGSRPLTDV